MSARRKNQKPRMLGSNPCHCGRCEYNWSSKMAHPSSCPRCGSIGWDKPRVKLANGESLERFMELLKTATLGTCLIWPYAKAGQNKYGSLTVNGVKNYAHHLAWIQTFGQIPEEKHVLHHCDTPACFNPYCLFLGSEGDNRADQKSKWRTCIGEENPMAKLTEFDVLEIRRLYQKGVKGYGQEALGSQFGIHRINIRKIVRRETWKHI
jgi:hypothetical protein